MKRNTAERLKKIAGGKRSASTGLLDVHAIDPEGITLSVRLSSLIPSGSWRRDCQGSVGGASLTTGYRLQSFQDQVANGFDWEKLIYYTSRN